VDKSLWWVRYQSRGVGELLSLHGQVELGILNAVEERRITVLMHERKVDFFRGVVAMAEGME